jgi:hypothetical protein
MKLEFMIFFPKGLNLNPFKIQTRFKFELFPEFVIQNVEGFGSGATKESCSLLSPKPLKKFHYFWTSGRSWFAFLKLEQLENQWNI